MDDAPKTDWSRDKGQDVGAQTQQEKKEFLHHPQ